MADAAPGGTSGRLLGGIQGLERHLVVDLAQVQHAADGFEQDGLVGIGAGVEHPAAVGLAGEQIQRGPALGDEQVLAPTRQCPVEGELDSAVVALGGRGEDPGDEGRVGEDVLARVEESRRLTEDGQVRLGAGSAVSIRRRISPVTAA